MLPLLRSVMFMSDSVYVVLLRTEAGCGGIGGYQPVRSSRGRGPDPHRAWLYSGEITRTVVWGVGPDPHRVWCWWQNTRAVARCVVSGPYKA